jgi:hypothetical protein
MRCRFGRNTEEPKNRGKSRLPMGNFCLIWTAVPHEEGNTPCPASSSLRVTFDALSSLAAIVRCGKRHFGLRVSGHVVWRAILMATPCVRI